MGIRVAKNRLFSLALCLGAMQLSAAPTPRILRIYDLFYEGKPYQAVVIQPSGQTSEMGYWGTSEWITNGINSNASEQPEVSRDDKGASFALADSILKKSQDWLMHLYENEGLLARDSTGEMRRSLDQSEKLTDPDTSLVILTEPSHSTGAPGNFEPGRILSMLRVVTPRSQSDLLPMEKRVENTSAAGKLARLEPKLEQKTELIWSHVPDPIPGSMKALQRPLPLQFKEMKNRWWYFATGELKSFARARDVNLIKPMLAIAAAHGMTLKSNVPVPKGFFDNRRLVTPTTGGIIMWPGPEEQMAARLGQLALECDGESHRKFFERLGFKVVRKFENPQMKGSTTYWMKGGIDDYNSRIVPSYLGKDLREVKGLALAVRLGNAITYSQCPLLYSRLAEPPLNTANTALSH